ncbi:MAG TPA: hypothetical protein PLF01_02610 [Alphaproteobacteria bacterium]|nr:hypothetical protein [Alphaproteobacteria bacterium]
MKRPVFLGLLSCVTVFSAVPAAYAGFEWTPPATQPAPSSEIEQQYRGDMNANASMNGAGGFPAAAVDSEPLGTGAPTQILPDSYYQQPPPQQMAPPAAPLRNLSGQGLHIDPYPLRNPNGRGQPVELSANSVNQAMVEEARVLNPLKLGAGLKTGAQPTPAAMPSAEGMANIPRGPIESGSLTPMMGGEPAPLPGMAQNMGMQQQPMAPMRQFAEAVGFGKELPLALALSQVIPSDFSHSFAAGVDPSVTVSWEGGKPWNEVLSDMLRSQNMTATIIGNNVTIQPMASL